MTPEATCENAQQGPGACDSQAEPATEARDATQAPPRSWLDSLQYLAPYGLLTCPGWIA